MLYLRILIIILQMKKLDVEEFLGRPMNNKAYVKSLGLE